MSIQRNLTDDELELLKIAGAHADFMAFVDIFPQSTAGQHVLGWFERGELTEENAHNGKAYSGGSFFDALWDGDIEVAYKMADKTNERHMETLFGKPVRSRLESIA